jgi:hypothetical protein
MPPKTDPFVKTACIYLSAMAAISFSHKEVPHMKFLSYVREKISNKK